MDSHTLEVITERLEAAERGLKATRRAIWWGSMLIGLAVGAAVWWESGGASLLGMDTRTVEAQHFVVRDAQGAARGALELSEAGAMQLVFYQDPLPGETWREHTQNGPFSFGVRSLSAQSQLVLSDRAGGDFQVTPGNLSFGRHETPSFLLSAGSPPGIWLADSTGHMQMLSASLIADVLAKREQPVRQPPRRRRGR